MQQQRFNSKYNIGQSISEGIYEDLTKAFDRLEIGKFNEALGKFRTIKQKIPSNKVSKTARLLFKALNSIYSKALKEQDRSKQYAVIKKYADKLIIELDDNSMYLPSLKDMSQFN